MAEKAKAAPDNTAPAEEVKAEIEYIVLHNAVGGKIRDYVMGEIVKAAQLIGDIEFYLDVDAVRAMPAKTDKV